MSVYLHDFIWNMLIPPKVLSTLTFQLQQLGIKVNNSYFDVLSMQAL